MNKNSQDWDRFGLSLAIDHAKMSKDPSTKVGAVIFGPDGESLCGGFNGFPRGVPDLKQHLNDREIKYKLIVHGEENAILVAARRGIKIKGCSLYYAAIDAISGDLVWGGAPCIRCTTSIIQVGISEVITFKAPIIDRWAGDMELAHRTLTSAGVKERLITPNEYDLAHAHNLYHR